MSLLNIFKRNSKDDLQSEIDEVANRNDERQTININTDNSFYMTVEDIFTISGRSTVVTGIIQNGSISVGDDIYIDKQFKTRVMGIESFRKMLDHADAGINVGILLDKSSKKYISKNSELSK